MADDFEELSDDDELTPEKLQEKLNEYAAAYKAEYELSTVTGVPEDLEQYTRDFFKKNIHGAAAQIVWLAGNSTSDSVRLNAAKYIVTEAFTKAEQDNDPIKDLLAKLQEIPGDTMITADGITPDTEGK